MNEAKFTGKAEGYAQHRPTYPTALLEYLYTELGFTRSSALADIGAGTGLWSRCLAARTDAVTCVEPNADMLAQARVTLVDFPGCRFVQAPAEATTLPDGSQDFVMAAQAFHWFDRSKFRAECRRILRPGGKVVLLWNCRLKDDPVVQAMADANRRHCPAFAGFSGGINEAPESFADFFAGGVCEYKVFDHPLLYTEEGFVGRSLSSSYAPREGQPQYEAYVAECREIFWKHCEGGLLKMGNVTRVYLGEV